MMYQNRLAVLLLISTFFLNADIPEKPAKQFFLINPAPIDVVIVCHEKDQRTLDLAIQGIKQYGNNIRNIITVSEKPLTQQALWFDESQFPFSRFDIAMIIFNNDEVKARAYIAHQKTRIGWIYQQLLKLYAMYVIPDISSNVLVIDADTIFLKPTSFIDEQGNGFFNVGTEYHIPYFVHARKVIPWFERIYPEHSGISHHMLFQKAILDDFMNTLRTIHHIEPWQALCSFIAHDELFGSSLSEFELYFNFTLAKTDQITIRPLKFKNSAFSQKEIDKAKQENCSYISCHSYL